MNKLKPYQNTHGSIAQKAIKELKKQANQKILKLQDYCDGKIKAERLSKTIVSQEKLSDYDPLHRIYIIAQNNLSVLIEIFGELSSLSRFANAYADAEDMYLPSGPPMSPLTTSYFTCWGAFDLCFGIKKETLATIAVDVCNFFSIYSDFAGIFKAMQQTRMGIYRHDGMDGNYVILTEAITGYTHRAVVPSGYLGESGELWLVRLFPDLPSDDTFGYSVVFTTPYVLTDMDDASPAPGPEAQWRSFFKRALPKTGVQYSAGAYDHLMKFGLGRQYWNEFIFEGYYYSRPEVIMLAGVPDLAETRPHSPENERY